MDYVIGVLLLLIPVVVVEWCVLDLPAILQELRAIRKLLEDKEQP